MELHQRNVVETPLKKLWTDEIELGVRKLRPLAIEDVVDLLKNGVVYFVIAEVGNKLEWINPERCFEFWKSEVKSHVIKNDGRAPLEEYPDGYLYVADEWESLNGLPVVTLEKHH